MKYVFVFTLLLSTRYLFAQTFNAAPFHAMGNTGLAMESLYSITNNAAGIGMLEDLAVAVAYQPHFMTKELRTQAAYVNVPIKNKGGLGLGIRNYGINKVSSFITANLVYARSFGSIFSSSVSANYHRSFVTNYISDNSFSLDLGTFIKVSEQINLGFLFRNPTFSKFNDDTEQYLPVEIGAGFLYKISSEISLASDTYYELEQGINLRVGLEYAIASAVMFRGGVSSNPMQYFGGFGLHWQKFQFDISSSFHSRLGSSPQFALAYAF